MNMATRVCTMLGASFVIGIVSAASVQAGYCKTDSFCKRTPCGTSACQCCKPPGVGNDWQCREDAPCTGLTPVEDPPFEPVPGG